MYGSECGSLNVMWKRRICIIIIISILPFLVNYTDGACTFPSVIRGTWVSSEKGSLNFTEDTIIDYPMAVTVAVQSITFVCDINSGDRYLLKSQSPFKLFQFSFNAFICLEFHRVSDYKYWYQVINDIDPTSQERVYAQPAGVSVTIDAGCNRTLPIANSTFNVLVKEGAVADGLAEATCPQSLFHTFSSGTLSSADGSTICSNSSLDVCTDRTAMIHTYDPTCDSSLQFSTDGTFVCLYDVTDDTTGVTYLHIWNNDTTLASGHVRIICYAFEKSDSNVVATVYPGACQETQNSTAVTSPGITAQYGSITRTCVDTVESGPQGIYYAAIILGGVGFLVLLAIIIIVTCITKCRCCKACCKKRGQGKIGHSDIDLRDDPDEYYRKSRAEGDAPPGVFVARKPVKLGPIIEPYLEPPAKIDLLYEVEPRPTSSRLMFSRSSFWSQLSLKNVTIDESSRQNSRMAKTPSVLPS